MGKELTLEEIEEIRKDPNNVNWFEISAYYILSEDFIREFKDKVEWWNICLNRTILSENFSREFQDKIDWYYISCTQNLSKLFIYEFYDKVYWSYLIKKHNFSDAPKHVKLYIAMNHRELLEYFK